MLGATTFSRMTAEQLPILSLAITLKEDRKGVRLKETVRERERERVRERLSETDKQTDRKAD